MDEILKMGGSTPNNEQKLIDKISSSYDEIPYISSAFEQCSPLKLEACANMLSINTTPCERAKILEIGCSFGGNLIPFALHNPNATIVGIDLSKEQIDGGKKLVSEFGLKNLELIEANVCDVKNSLDKYGKFDYIICHGVYSWVPDIVKEAILKLIKDRLAPNGVACVSYNVYPGWKFKDVVRDFMKFVSSGVDGLNDKLEFSKIALKIYKKTLEKIDSKEAKVIIKWIDNILERKNQSYLAHEYLEDINNPFYFKDFAKSLSKFNLEYLCESDMNDIFSPDTGIEEADEFMRENLKDRIDEEQFMDFVVNRPFRQSLIVHKETFSKVKQDISVNEINKLHIISYFEQNDDGYIKNGKAMSNKYDWLYSVFNDIYPASINLSDILTFIEPNLKLSTYTGFIEILSKDCTFMPKRFTKVRYNPGETRLKPNLVPYIKYFLNTDFPVISFANEFNQMFHDMKKIGYYVALKFDGKNSYESIVADFLKFMKQNKITPRDEKGKEIKGADKINKFALNYIIETENILSQMYFFEEIS